MSPEEYQAYLASRVWALKKLEVRRRSNGFCERPHREPVAATSVHHKTYARVGHEALDDLIHVCEECHKYLSGKLDEDPCVALIYLAGKIAKNDWRHVLFPDLDDSDGPRQRDGFLVAGPHFLACDHGCYHGEHSHGVGADGYGCDPSAAWSQRRAALVCRGQIEEADVVFAWMDSLSAYGTLAELGFAHAMSKPVFLAYPSESAAWNDTWFVRMWADEVAVPVDVEEAWRIFVAWWGDRGGRS